MEIVAFKGAGAIRQIIDQLKLLGGDSVESFFGVGFLDSESGKWVFEKHEKIDHIEGALKRYDSKFAVGTISSISRFDRDLQPYLSLSGKTIILFS